MWRRSLSIAFDLQTNIFHHSAVRDLGVWEGPIDDSFLRYPNRTTSTCRLDSLKRQRFQFSSYLLTIRPNILKQSNYFYFSMVIIPKIVILCIGNFLFLAHYFLLVFTYVHFPLSHNHVLRHSINARDTLSGHDTKNRSKRIN